MQGNSCHEEEREILTNADIKTDLKKEITFELAVGSGVLLLCLLLLWALFRLLHSSSEYFEVGFWAFLFCVLSIYVIWLIVYETIRAITYIRAIGRNRFFVACDKLIDKQEGRSDRHAPRGHLSKPNRYRFAGGTYKAAVSHC